MSKKIKILLLLLSFFIIPAGSYACCTDTDDAGATCCSPESGSGDGAACCNSHDAEKKAYEGCCDGLCEHTSCSCPTVHSSFALPFLCPEAEMYKALYFFQKATFYETGFNLSSGFYSVWLPPKIA